MAQYRALTGLDYPPNRRAEAGDVIDDLPGKSVKWLLESGLIEPAGGAKPATGQKSTPDKPKAPAPPVEPVIEEDED